MRDVFHWLPIAERICFRMVSLVWRSLLGIAPIYLSELCSSVSVVPARRSLRYAVAGELLVPRTHTAIRQHRAFAVAGPPASNGLPVELRTLPRVGSEVFFTID